MTKIKKSSITGPLDWDLIKSFHCNPPKFTLPRTLQVINDYENHISKIKKINKTVGEYLKGKFFKNGESYQIEPNLFPYHLENNDKYYMEHYIIWFNEKLNIHDIVVQPNCNIDKIIKKFIDTEININQFNTEININQSNTEININQSNTIDYIYFENELKNKSVPEIRHLHLFIKFLKS